MLAVITSDRTQVSADALASAERPPYGISHLHTARHRGKEGGEKRGEGVHTLTRCSDSFHTTNSSPARQLLKALQGQ